MADVTLEHIKKSYDKTSVIEDLTLAIADKEFVVLVGPSGCGKSTVLRMIAGLEPITEGTIAIDNHVVNDVHPKDRDIAMVFQNYALYPHMTVFDNMAFGLKMRKTPKADIEKRVHEAADVLDVSHLLGRKPKQLSGGQRQRVALGRAIVRNPKVFLMDEPLSNLDAKLRVQMRTEIQKLHQQLQATTIYVTHDQVEAMTMGDRIVVLHEGIIQQVGTPDAIYNHPVNRFVGGFIGSMHYITGRYEKGHLHCEGTQWTIPDSVQSVLNEKGCDEQTIEVGLRPEHFSPLEGEQSVVITPDIVEMLGHQKVLHFTLAETPLVAAVPADFEVTVGEPVSLLVNLEKASYFDVVTGNNMMVPKG